MKPGVWNLGLGLIAMALGATGRFSLLFTHSSTALVVAGALMAAYGAYQLWKSRGT